jgi:hypothetical protein
MSVKIKRNYGKIDISSIPEEYLDFVRVLLINGFTDVQIKAIIDEKINTLNYKIFNESEYGTVHRKEKDVDEGSLIRHLTPFGIENGKIILPEFYNYIKKENSEEPDIETIYNLCMCYNNFYFYLLLTFDQKYKLYELLVLNPKKRLFGYREQSADFEFLYDNLNRYVFHIDPFDSFNAIRLKLKSKTTKISDEMKLMIDQNIKKYSEFIKFNWSVGQLMLRDKLIEENLRSYVPLIYHFNKDNIVFKKLQSGDFLVNGVPQIRSMKYPENPIV